MTRAAEPGRPETTATPSAPPHGSSLGLILFTVFIDLIGFGIVIPVLPLYAERFGASTFAIGALMATYSAMTFVFSPILGRLSDRFGRRPVLFVSILGTSAGFWLMGAANSLALLFLARLIDGASGGNISTAQAYIADVTPPEGRARAMGFLGAAFGLGFVLGPAIGGTMSLISLSAPFYFAAALAAVNALLVYFRLPESLEPEHRSQDRRRPHLTDLWRRVQGRAFRAIVGTYFISTVGFAMMTTLYALFASHRFGFDAVHTGYLFAFVGLIGAAIQGGLMGRLVARFGERLLASGGAVALAAGLFLLPLSRSLLHLLVASAVVAIGNSLMTPTLNALASRSADATWQGRAMGLMQSAGSLGRICGPLLAGWLLSFDLGGLVDNYARTPLWTSAALLLGAFLYSRAIPVPRPTEGSAGGN